MKLKTKSMILAVSLLAATYAPNAMAGQVVGTIESFQMGVDGGMSFALDGAPLLCSNGNYSNYRAALNIGVRGVTVDGYKALLSAINSAFLARKRVRVYTDENVKATGWGCTLYAIDVMSN
jgi:hypothetical protein